MNPADIMANVELRLHPTYAFRFGPDWLQVIDTALPADEGHGRKWRLSEHMTRNEVIQTGLAAMLAFQEHEVRESFCYKGKPIFSPHYSVDALWAIHHSSESFDVR